MQSAKIVYTFYLSTLLCLLIGCSEDSLKREVTSPSLSSVTEDFITSDVQITIRSNVRPERSFRLKAVEWDGVSDLLPDVAYEVPSAKKQLFDSKISEMTTSRVAKKKSTGSQLSAVQSGDKCYVMAFAGRGGFQCISEAQASCFGEKHHSHYWHWNGGEGYYYHTDPYGEWSYVESSINRTQNYWWCRSVLERDEHDYYVDTDVSPFLACIVQLPKVFPPPAPYDTSNYILYERILVEDDSN